MRWSYGDLMDLPADLYDELVAWLMETKPSMDGVD
jgi:hypothetical protein